MAELANTAVDFVGDRGNTKQTIIGIPAQAAANKPGILMLQDVDDSGVVGEHYEWYDHTGAKRTSTSIPTNQDSDGTVISGNTTMAILTAYEDDVCTAGAAYAVSPVAGTITKIYSVIHGTIGTANCTVTAAVQGGTAIPETITIAYSGSNAGDIDSCTPASNNTVTAGQRISLTTDGAGSNVVPCDYTILISM